MAGGLASNVDSETVAKLKATARHFEEKTKELETELEKIKKNMRFTKIAELETELKIYYEEVC
jgi:hypothetical protein